MNRPLIAAITVLCAGSIATADVYSENCDKMRDLAVTLSVNLQAIDKNESSIAVEAEKQGKQVDLKSSNVGIKNIADAIDGLTYKIDQQCK